MMPSSILHTGVQVWSGQQEASLLHYGLPQDGQVPRLSRQKQQDQRVHRL